MRRGSRPAAKRSTRLERGPKWRNRIRCRRWRGRRLQWGRWGDPARHTGPYDEVIVHSRNAESDDDDDLVDLGLEPPLPKPPPPSPPPLRLPRERATRERAR